MASATNVVTLGMAPQLANLMAENSAAITAAGTTSSDATACGAGVSTFIVTATGSDGIRMSSTTPLLRPIWVFNTSGSNGKVYPHTGGTVNGGSTDAGETIATTTAQCWMRLSSTAWGAILGA